MERLLRQLPKTEVTASVEAEVQSPTTAPSLTTIQRWATPEPFLLQVRQRIPPTLVVLGELRVGGAPQSTNIPRSPGVSAPGSTHQVSSQCTESTCLPCLNFLFFCINFKYRKTYKVIVQAPNNHDPQSTNVNSLSLWLSHPDPRHGHYYEIGMYLPV